MAEPKKPMNPVLSLLKGDGKQKLADYCCERIASKGGAMSTWKTARKKYAAQAEDDFSWRTGLRGDNEIFNKQNDSLNIIGGFADFLTARTIDDILGGEPYFALQAEGKSDKDEANGIEKHSEWKLRQSNLKGSLKDAIKKAYDVGEGILKIRWKKVTDTYERLAQVLVDSKTRKPILRPDGEYITDEDELVVEREANPKKGGPGAITRISLKDDPEVDLTKHTKTEYAAMYIEETITRWENVDCRCIDHADFIASLLVSDLEEDDFVGHLFDLRLDEAKRLYNLDAATISKLVAETTEAKTESEKPRPGTAESEEHDGTEQALHNPTIQFCECYCNYELGGKMRRLLVVVGVAQRVFIEVDYLANVTPRGRLPFFPQRAFKAGANRWYGVGMYQACEAAQLFIDRHLSMISYRNRLHSSPVKFVNPDAVHGLDSEEDFVIDCNKTYRLKQDKKKEEALDFLVLPDLDDRTMELMQTMIQVVQLRRGIPSAAQGSVESLPQNSTATGIDAMLSSGSVLSRMPIGELRDCLEKAVEFAIEVLYSNQDKAETFTYLEGQDPMVATIGPQDVRNLKMNVRLLLTRFREREMRENAQIAIQAVEQYGSTPPQMQEGVREFYLMILKSLGFENSDEALPAPSSLPAAQPAPPPL